MSLIQKTRHPQRTNNAPRGRAPHTVILCYLRSSSYNWLIYFRVFRVTQTPSILYMRRYLDSDFMYFADVFVISGLENKIQRCVLFCKNICFIRSRFRRGGANGEKSYSSYSFLTSALNGGEWSASRPGHLLLPGKDSQYPLDRRLGWPLFSVFEAET
jgi:hypothetical protein